MSVQDRNNMYLRKYNTDYFGYINEQKKWFRIQINFWKKISGGTLSN